MISCTEAVRALWEYLDNTVEPAERTAIDHHLDRCLRCCGELEFAMALRRTLAQAGHEDIPGPILHRLTSLLEDLQP